MLTGYRLIVTACLPPSTELLRCYIEADSYSIQVEEVSR
jgi:hypothetical protein